MTTARARRISARVDGDLNRATVPSRPPKTPAEIARDRFAFMPSAEIELRQFYLDDAVRRAATVLSVFAERLAGSNPLSALAWADDAFTAAAQRQVLSAVNAALIAGKSLAAITEHFEDEARRQATRDPRSTSACSNLAETAERIAVIEVARRLRAFFDSRLAAAALIAEAELYA